MFTNFIKTYNPSRCFISQMRFKNKYQPEH